MSSEVLAVQVTDEAPRIDGRLEDSVWQRAARIASLTQAEPKTGAPGSQATEVWVSFDHEALYVAVRAHVATAGDIRASNLNRDDNSESDDEITVVLDPFDSRQQGYAFTVNPLGARREALLSGDSEPQIEWDCVWFAATAIDQQSWTAELRIPFNSVALDPAQTTWAFNVQRVMRVNNEVQRWAGARPELDVTTLSNAGSLTGLNELHHGGSLELVPTLVLKQLRTPGGDREFDAEPSLEASWRIRPALTAALSVNTDFAETEVDEVQSNYTRFALQLPEQRDFFLSSANYFKFADREDSPMPFFSRRIGLDGEGQPVDIKLGVKLAGRTGPWTLGLLHADTGRSDTVAAKHLSVARVNRQIGESSLGLIGTVGDPRDAGDAHLVGADYNYLDSEWLPGKRLSTNLWYMQTRSDAAGGAGRAVGGALKFPNEPWWGSVSMQHIDARFDPALGFLARSGVRNYYTALYRRWRPDSAAWRSIEIGEEGTLITDTNNHFDSYQYYLPNIALETQTGMELYAALEWNRERLNESFEPARGVTINAGDYVFLRPFFKIVTPSSRPLSGLMRYLGGRYYDGSLETLRTEATWKPSSHWLAAVRYEFGALRAQGGRADIHLTTFKLNWLHSTSISISNTLQYDSEARSAGINSRLRWTVRGDNDLFLVFQRGYVDENVEDQYGQLRETRRYSQAMTAKVEWHVSL